MKIVLVYDKLNTGGTEKLFVMIANLLHRKGHEVKVVIIKDKGELDADILPEIQITYLNRKNKYSIFKMKQLASICKQADVVHLHSYYNWRYLYTSSIFFRMGKARMILHEHSDMRNIRSYDKGIFPNLDAFIAVHPLQVHEAVEAGIKKQKVFLLPNIVETKGKGKPLFEKKHKILMVGNIRREKYYQLAFDILQKLPSHITIDIYCNISDDLYYNELQQLIKEYKIIDRVKFIHGVKDVTEYFYQYDLAIHTANNETGPLVVLEYLAARLPFFTSSAGQSPVLLSGILPQVVISSYNAKIWVAQIEQFYSITEEAYKRLIDELNCAARKLLNQESYYQSLIQVYQESHKG